MQTKGLGHLENLQKTLPEIEPETSRLVAQCLNHLICICSHSDHRSKYVQLEAI
jgi:hypothetical protein